MKRPLYEKSAKWMESNWIWVPVKAVVGLTAISLLVSGARDIARSVNANDAQTIKVTNLENEPKGEFAGNDWVVTGATILCRELGENYSVDEAGMKMALVLKKYPTQYKAFATAYTEYDLDEIDLKLAVEANKICPEELFAQGERMLAEEAAK